MDGPLTDNELQRAATDAAATAIGNYLMESGRLAAPIRSLTFAELQGIASAAVSGWIVARAEQAKTEKPDLWKELLHI
jgi:hypothetical protein